MAIAYVRDTGEKKVTAANSLAGSFGVTPAAGSLIVVCANAQGTGLDGTWPASGCTDNQGNTYTQAKLQAINAGAPGLLEGVIFFAYNVAASGTFTLTLTPPGGGLPNISWIAAEFSGLGVGALDQTASGGSAATTADTSSTATTVDANELVIANTALSTAPVSISTPSGYTQLYQELLVANQAAAADYKIVSATGAQQAQWSLGVSDTYAAVIATFRVNLSVTIAPTAAALVATGASPVLATVTPPTPKALAATGATPSLAMVATVPAKALATSLSAPSLAMVEQPTALALAVALATPVLALALSASLVALAVGASTPDAFRTVYGQGPSGSASIGRVGPSGSASVTARGPGGTAATTKGPGGSARISL